MVKTSNTEFNSAAMWKGATSSPSSTVFSREVLPPSTLNINITAPAGPTPQDVTSTQYLESRLAVIESSLAGINETFAKANNVQSQGGRLNGNPVPQDETSKDLASRVDSLAVDIGAIKNSLDTITNLMTDNERVHRSTGISIGTLFIELENAQYTTRVNSALVEQVTKALRLICEGLESPMKGSEEEGEQEPKEKHSTLLHTEADKESEKDDENEEEPGLNDVMTRLNQVVYALATQSNTQDKICKTLEGVEATHNKVEGIDTLLQQQKQIQTSIARVKERCSVDLARIMNLVGDLTTAVDRQAETMRAILRRQLQIESGLHAVKETVGVSDDVSEDDGDQYNDYDDQYNDYD